MLSNGRASRAFTLVVCLFAGLVPASAADPEIEALKQELRMLKERVSAQQAEIDQLKQRAPAQAAAAAPTAPAPTRAVPESAAQATSMEGGKPWYADRLQLGGYGSLRFETNDAGVGRGFTMRRFVLTTDARLSSRIRLYTETELERLHEIEIEKGARAEAGGLRLSQAVEGNNGAEIGLEQAWAQFNFTEKHGFRAGVVLPPLGRFNVLHDDDYWDLPRRTLVDRDGPVTPVKTAWRELGAGFVGGFDIGEAGKLDYQFYVLNGATLDFNVESVAQTRRPQRTKMEFEGSLGLTSGAFDGSQSARAFAWRAAYSPTLAGEFALSGYHGRYVPLYLGVSEPVNSLGFDYKWRWRALELEGEVIYSSFGKLNRVAEALARTIGNSSVETSSAETRRLESEIEFEFGGLARTRYGFWNDIKYHWRPALLKRSFLGRPFEDPQLIPIIRYERVWLNRNLSELAFQAGAITALETQNLQQDRLSAGLTYRPVRALGFQFAYEHNRRIDGPVLVFPRIAKKSVNGFVSGLVFGF